MRHRWELKVAPGSFPRTPRLSPVPPLRGLGRGQEWLRDTLASSSGGGGREAAAWRLALGYWGPHSPGACGGTESPLGALLDKGRAPPQGPGTGPMLAAQVSGPGHSQCWDMAHAVAWCQQGQWDVASATSYPGVTTGNGMGLSPVSANALASL